MEREGNQPRPICARAADRSLPAYKEFILTLWGAEVLGRARADP